MVKKFRFLSRRAVSDDVRDTVEQLRCQNAELSSRLETALRTIEEISTTTSDSRRETGLNAQRIDQLEHRARALERVLRVAEKRFQRVIARAGSVEAEFESLKCEQARLSKQAELDAAEARKSATAIAEQLLDVCTGRA